MKILVIGATGHVGSYLVERLAEEGHEIFAVTRGNRKSYGNGDLWEGVHSLRMTRAELCESGVIEQIKPDAVCDLIAYHIDEVKSLLGKIGNAFYVLIGSIWAYENKLYLPVDEEHPKNATEQYGLQKGVMEDYVLALCREGKLRGTVIHPGHVSAKEWMPINPQGNLNGGVYEDIKKGRQTVLPYEGLTTLHHVHSRDLAEIITASIEKQDVSNGQAFIAVAKRAMTMRAICEVLYARYGHKPNLRYLEWAEFERTVGKENAAVSYDHVYHSPCCTVEKAERMLGVQVKYSIEDIMNEYLDHQG